MQNIYLARVMTGPMSGMLESISREEWIAILRMNKTLPAESKRYFIIDCIIDDEELDRMFIEVDRDTYDEWHRENQAAYRNRIAKNLFSHLSLDAVVDNTESVTLHDTISSGYCLENHASAIMNISNIREQLKEWRPWANELLDAMISGTFRDCTHELAQKYGITDRAMQYNKQHFIQKIKTFQKELRF